jgi:hypothetical protein
VVGDPAEHVGQPSLRVDTVQLGGLDQGVGDSGRLAAAFGADEEKILPAQRDRLHRPFRRVVVRLQAAMVEVGPQLPQAGQGVADRLGQLGLAGDLRQQGVQLVVRRRQLVRSLWLGGAA